MESKVLLSFLKNAKPQAIPIHNKKNFFHLAVSVKMYRHYVSFPFLNARALVF